MIFPNALSLKMNLVSFLKLASSVYLLVDLNKSNATIFSSGKTDIFSSLKDCGDIWTEADDLRCKSNCENANTVCIYDFHYNGNKCICAKKDTEGNKQSGSRSIASSLKEKETPNPKSGENATLKPISTVKSNKSSFRKFKTGFGSQKNRNMVNQKMCGRIKSHGSRIVGGKNADIKEFPWLVMVAPVMDCNGKPTYCMDDCINCIGKEIDSEKELKCPSGDCHGSDVKYICGGALISDFWVLTAGHCLSNQHTGYKIKLGATKRTQTKGFQVIDAEKWVKHNEYDGFGFKNDIALIKMKTKFKDTTKTNTICLPLDKTKNSRYHKEDMSGEYDAIIAGWGYTTKWANQGPLADTLQKLPVKIIKHEKCKENMGGYAEVYQYDALHPDKNICAGGEYEKDSCGGDSGGPLVTMKKVGRHKVYTVIGLTSWGPTMCGAQANEYGIYTNVAYFNDWILNNIS